MKLKKKLLTLSLIVAVASCLAVTQIATLAYAGTSVVRTKELGVTYWDPAKAYNGYTLFAPLSGKDAWLIDMQGRIVHHWELPSHPGCYAKLLPNGHLLYACGADPAKKRAAGVPRTSGQ